MEIRYRLSLDLKHLTTSLALMMMIKIMMMMIAGNILYGGRKVFECEMQNEPFFDVTLSWWRPVSYRNQSIDLFIGLVANQWIGFYMIGTSAMKQLNLMI